MVNQCLKCGNFCSQDKDYCCEKCSNGLCPKEEKRSCKYCDSEIITTPSENKKFCDQDCFQNFEEEYKNIEKTCPYCDCTFITPKSVDSKYCSKQCMGKYFSENQIGFESANWQGGKLEKECLNCNQVFEVWPKRFKATYCSKKCMAEDYRSRFSGEENPNYNRVQVECDYCSKKLLRIPYRIQNYDKHFCNFECEGDWLSENKTGENHPNWSGGYPDYYGENWIEQREKALIRDDYKCIICKKDKSDLGRNPSVHHLKPIRKFDQPEEANDLDNLICLCANHHNLVEGWNLAPANILDK